MTSSQNEDNQVNNNSEEKTESSQEFVSKKVYKEVSSDMMKYKSEVRELKSKLAQFEAEKELSEKAKMAENAQWEQLAKKLEEEKNQLLTSWETEKKQSVKSQKINAALSIIGTLERPEFAQFIPDSEIKINEDGSVDQESLQLVVNKFKQEFAVCIKKENKATVNTTKTAPTTIDRSVLGLKPVKDMSWDEIKKGFTQQTKK